MKGCCSLNSKLIKLKAFSFDHENQKKVQRFSQYYSSLHSQEEINTLKGWRVFSFV